MIEYLLNQNDIIIIQNKFQSTYYDYMSLDLFVMMEYKARLKRTHKSESMYKLVFENENDYNWFLLHL